MSEIGNPPTNLFQTSFISQKPRFLSLKLPAQGEEDRQLAFYTRVQ